MHIKELSLFFALLLPSVLSADCNTPVSVNDVPDFIAPEHIDSYLADARARQNDLCFSSKGIGQDKAVYFIDNRYDAYLAKGAVRKAARSTAALIQKTKLRKEGGYYVATQNNTLQKVGWCASEPFANQPTLATCSGFLVDQDILVSAGHCFRYSGFPIDEYYVVFGYEMLDEQRVQLRFPEKDVYLISKELEVKKNDASHQDWGVVQLNRRVTDRQIFEFKADEIAKETKLTLFGYPIGLPLKISNGGKVLENKHNKNVFASDVDAFHGNSGSPVLNSEALNQNPPRFIVEGILVAGARDFDKRKANSQGCASSVTCQSININYNGGDCSSEIVTKINRVLELDATPAEPYSAPPSSSSDTQDVLKLFQ